MKRFNSISRVLLGWGLLSLASGAYAQSGWVTVSDPSSAGQPTRPIALGFNKKNDMYVVDADGNQIRKQDGKNKKWSLVAKKGRNLEPFRSAFNILEHLDDLYMTDTDSSCIRKRDPNGNWRVVAPMGRGLGQVYIPTALTVDLQGNLYVADETRIQMRDPKGRWTVLSKTGRDPGSVLNPRGLVVDGAGNLYVADTGNNRIQKRDAKGNWSVLATEGSNVGNVLSPWGIAVDAEGNLYVSENDAIYEGIGNSRVQRWNAQGGWSILAKKGKKTDEVDEPFGLAVDAAGDLYVSDAGNRSIKKYKKAAK